MLKNYLLVFFISMVPLIELRGAIPIGLGMGLPILPTYLVCVLGNMLPVPFIYLFARKFLIWGYHKPLIGPVCKFCITKGEKGRPRTGGQGRQGPDRCAAALCGHPAAGHRRVDRHAGSLHSGYEVQGCAHCLHGRCAAGGHHHGFGQRRPVGCAAAACLRWADSAETLPWWGAFCLAKKRWHRAIAILPQSVRTEASCRNCVLNRLRRNVSYDKERTIESWIRH